MPMLLQLSFNFIDHWLKTFAITVKHNCLCYGFMLATPGLYPPNENAFIHLMAVKAVRLDA